MDRKHEFVILSEIKMEIVRKRRSLNRIFLFSELQLTFRCKELFGNRIRTSIEMDYQERSI